MLGIESAKREISKLKGIIKGKLEEVEKKINNFENKYAFYIQEGTWADESYFDDDLYYYDA
jgi:hypothetical protein